MLQQDTSRCVYDKKSTVVERREKERKEKTATTAKNSEEIVCVTRLDLSAFEISGDQFRITRVVCDLGFHQIIHLGGALAIAALVCTDFRCMSTIITSDLAVISVMNFEAAGHLAVEVLA